MIDLRAKVTLLAGSLIACVALLLASTVEGTSEVTGFLPMIVGGSDVEVSSTPTPEISPTATPNGEPSTATPTVELASVTPTAELPTATSTTTMVATPNPSATASATPEVAETPAPTVTPTATWTATPFSTPAATVTATSTSTPSPPTPTATPAVQHFDCVSRTGGNATVAIPASVGLTGMPGLAEGDEVAVFVPDSSLCAGVVLWNGENVAIAAWGDDPQTTEIDGLQNGQVMAFRIWDQSAGQERQVESVAFSMGNGIYSADSIHAVSSFTVAPVQSSAAHPTSLLAWLAELFSYER